MLLISAKTKALIEANQKLRMVLFDYIDDERQ